MSYSLNASSCYNCQKRDQCTDRDRIQEGIDKIHENCLEENGHLGSGEIIVHCNRQVSVS